MVHSIHPMSVLYKNKNESLHKNLNDLFDMPSVCIALATAF